MSTSVTVVGVLIILGGIYKLLFRSSKTPQKVVELQIQAAQVQHQITATVAERETLKETVVTEQANATEDQKTDFWNKELGVKKDE